MTSALRPLSLALLLAGLLAVVPAQAQTFKAGFINVDRVLREATPSKAAQARLEQDFSKREKDIVEQGTALRLAGEKFEREAPTMAESQRAARQRQLIEQDREFQRKRREYEEDLSARKNEELGQMLQKVNRAVKQLAEAENYDAILQDAAYINPKHDITDKIIKAMNAAGNGGK